MMTKLPLLLLCVAAVTAAAVTVCVCVCVTIVECPLAMRDATQAETYIHITRQLVRQSSEE